MCPPCDPPVCVCARVPVLAEVPIPTPTLCPLGNRHDGRLRPNGEHLQRFEECDSGYEVMIELTVSQPYFVKLERSKMFMLQASQAHGASKVFVSALVAGMLSSQLQNHERSSLSCSSSRLRHHCEASMMRMRMKMAVKLIIICLSISSGLSPSL